MRLLDKLFKRHSNQNNDNQAMKHETVLSKQTVELIVQETPFPDRHKLIEWKIEMLDKAFASKNLELINKQYAGLIETVRQQNINTNGLLNDYLNSIRDEYDKFRTTYNLEYPQECLPPWERKENNNTLNRTSQLSDNDKLNLHSSNMREATKLKESGEIRKAINLIYQSQQQTGYLENEKLSSYLSLNNEIEDAVEVLKSAMNKNFPYNNHSHYWKKISSIYFKHKDFDRYLYALTMSIFYGVIHYFPIIGDKKLVNEFYKSQSVEYIGLPNILRFIKIIKQPDFIEKYNTILMPFFNDIQPMILEICKFREYDKFTEKEMLFFNQYTLSFFSEFYHDKIKKNIFDNNE